MTLTRYIVKEEYLDEFGPDYYTGDYITEQQLKDLSLAWGVPYGDLIEQVNEVDLDIPETITKESFGDNRPENWEAIAEYINVNSYMRAAKEGGDPAEIARAWLENVQYCKLKYGI